MRPSSASMGPVAAPPTSVVTTTTISVAVSSTCTTAPTAPAHVSFTKREVHRAALRRVTAGPQLQGVCVMGDAGCKGGRGKHLRAAFLLRQVDDERVGDGAAQAAQPLHDLHVERDGDGAQAVG